MKIFGLGLPRSYNTSILMALLEMYREVPDMFIAHSPAFDWDRIADQHIGAVQVWAPIQYLEEKYPGSLYILNIREVGSWLASCLRKREDAIGRNFLHPLWRYAPDQWEAYRDVYHRQVLADAPVGRTLAWSIPDKPGPQWNSLCSFLGRPRPPGRFPDADMMVGRIPRMASQHATENLEFGLLC